MEGYLRIGPANPRRRRYLIHTPRAAKLGVHESQVSRDERNEYHGITVERAIKILDTLGVKLQTSVVEAPLGVEADELQNT